MQHSLNDFLERVNRYVRGTFQERNLQLGIRGGFSSLNDLGQRLQNAVLDFARTYSDKRENTQELSEQADLIEGYIRTGQSLGALSEEEAAELLRELDNLVEERK